MVVRELMKSDVKTLARNDRLDQAEQLMAMGRVRHLPVLDEYGDLAGIVSQRDLFFNALLRALGFGSTAKEKTLEQLRVKECMTENVITVGPDESAADAARCMIEKKVGCLPVVERGKLVGIVTETDFVAAFAESQTPD